MRTKAAYRFAVLMLMAQIFFSDFFPCYASQIGSGAYSMDNGSEIAQPTPPAPAISSVSVSPGTTVVSKSSSYAFVASVAGQNNYSQEVTWSVHGQTSRNTFIDSSGILHVGFDETSPSLIVKAVSKQDSNYSATALASVQTSDYSIQVRVSPDNGGTVHGGGTVKEGGYIVISAVPNNGYTFDGWLLNNNRVSGDSQYTVENIHSDAVYIAEFKPINCQINVSVNNTNAGTATESRTVKYGESVTLEATAKEGYQFDGWMENGTTVSTDSRLQLNNITSSRNLTAMFSQNKYSLTLNCWPAASGTVSGQGTYDKGSNVKITAAPIGGYRFVSWSENGNVISTDQEYSVNDISRDMFLLATFEKVQTKTYSITATSSSSGGKIVPEGKSDVPEGSGISYVIIPQEGYVTKAVYVDGKSVGAVSSYSFSNVKENHSILADFVAKADQDAGGNTAENEKDKADNEIAQNKDTEGMQEEEENELTGTLQYLNISAREAERMIDENDDLELMKGALENGDLQVIVHNDFADIVQEISAGGFEKDFGDANLEMIWGRFLTKEEKLEMLEGNVPVTVKLSIDDTDGEEAQSTIKSFGENKLPGMTIGRYFEIRLTKSGKSDTQTILELPEELRMVIDVPKHLRADNREFYILRLHTNEDGSQDFAQLSDEDDNPDTITFSTDKFSPYAIAYIDRTSKAAGDADVAKDVDNDKGMINVIAVMAFAVAAAITLWLVWYIVRKKRRRK